MNVVIVSPRTFTRKGLSVYLARTPGVRQVAELESALDNLESLRKKPPHVVILDVVDGDGDLAVAERMKKHLPTSRILLLTEGNDEEFEVRALRAGTYGCISKRCLPHELARAVVTAARGEMWISHRVATSALKAFLSDDGRSRRQAQEKQKDLSPREWEILALVGTGYRDKEIAEGLHLSENTVKTHLKSIYKTLGVNSRTDASLYYLRLTKSNSRASVNPQPKRVSR